MSHKVFFPVHRKMTKPKKGPAASATAQIHQPRYDTLCTQRDHSQGPISFAERQETGRWDFGKPPRLGSLMQHCDRLRGVVTESCRPYLTQDPWEGIREAVTLGLRFAFSMAAIGPVPPPLWALLSLCDARSWLRWFLLTA